MKRVEVTEYAHPQGWNAAASSDQLSKAYCQRLEAGEILYFPGTPFEFPEADRQTLLHGKQSGLKIHKNISYRPAKDILRGVEGSAADQAEVRRIMQSYSRQSADFLGRFLTPYAGGFALDYASFRPIEEDGRDLTLHKRNDLLHVDAFPTRPTGGGRILRLFTNINPNEPRRWITSDPFPPLAERYAKGAGLDHIAASAASPVRNAARKLAGFLPAGLGLKGLRATPYDRFMLQFHDHLKENETYQRDCARYADDFPPGSTWMVYTDSVPHAVLSGRYAIEQTFIVSVNAMVKPEISPLRVLERLSGVRLGT